MKLLYILFIIIFWGSAFSQTKKVKIKLVQYLPYCGGAKPTPEILKSTEKATPYANKKLILISDKEKIDTITTDKSGNVCKKLTYGTYKVYEPWKFYKRAPSGVVESNVKMDCLKEEWVKEDLKITVTKKSTLVENNLKYPKCAYQFPCLINKHMPR
ncbi:MAG: hypothetical protein V4677_02845 [Bacteroidota bacterium]